MFALNEERLRIYRAGTFRLQPDLRLHHADEAVAFVNGRGFVAFWPIKDMLLPSLWVATAGDRPIPDEHDDPGHVSWGWKDELLGQRRWYYARILFHRNTIISLAALPYFYALSENFGDYTEDHLVLYEQGRLSQPARAVYEALLENGPLDTLALRKAARLTSHENMGRFNKALDDLQRDFKVQPVGVSDSGAWHYSFIYELTARHHPELPVLARPITEREAGRALAEMYFRSLGAARLRDLTRCLGWKDKVASVVVADLVQQGVLVENISLPASSEAGIALRELV